MEYYKFILVTNRKNVPIHEYIKFLTKCRNVSSIQVREKHSYKKEILELIYNVKSALPEIPVIVNDSIEIALKSNADGVHIGQGDGDPIIARDILGPDKIIGLTVNSMEEIRAANDIPVDYIGISSVFDTMHKSDIQHVWGIDGVREAAAVSKHKIVGIGGIDESNASSVIRAGADGIAVIGALHNSHDPAQAISRFTQEIENAKKDK